MVSTQSPRLRRRMIAMFDGYGERYKQLSKEYEAYPNIRFYDARGLFKDFALPAYVDLIHYTPAAQRALAERMFNDLSQFPVVKSRLAR